MCGVNKRLKEVVFSHNLVILGAINHSNVAFVVESLLIKKPLAPKSFLQQIAFVCGTITDVQNIEGARNPSYKMTAIFGEKVSAGQFVKNYSMGELLNKQVWGILNFDKRRIAGVNSEYLTVGFYDEAKNAVALNNRECIVENGTVLGENSNLPSDYQTIGFDLFQKLEIKVGRIIKILGAICNVDFGLHKSKVNFEDMEMPPKGSLASFFMNSEEGITPLYFVFKDKKIALGVDERNVLIVLGGELG